MDNDEMAGDMVRLDGGYIEEAFVVHDDGLDQEENNSDSNCSKNVPLREQDRFLPIANIAKIMKRAIPENGKIAKDARECVQECISEFISFVTSEASERCQVEKRKTINGEDVLYALQTLGFDSYLEPLKLYLKKYRELLLSPAGAVNNRLQGKLLHVYEDERQELSENAEMHTTDDGTVIYTYDKNIEFIG